MLNRCTMHYKLLLLPWQHTETDTNDTIIRLRVHCHQWYIVENMWSIRNYELRESQNWRKRRISSFVKLSGHSQRSMVSRYELFVWNVLYLPVSSRGFYEIFSQNLLFWVISTVVHKMIFGKADFLCRGNFKSKQTRI